MLDFIRDENHIPSWLIVLYVGVTFLMYIISAIEVNSIRSNKRYDRKCIAMFIFMTIFAIFYCINTDYFNYRELVFNARFFIGIGKGVEFFPNQIALLSNGNYDIFRMLIWGSAIFLFIKICRILEFQPFYALLFWYIIFHQYIFYARSTLAMAVFFAGCAFIITSNIKNRSFRFILGHIIAISSFFFHKELLVAIALLPCLYFKFEKKHYIILLAVAVLIGVPLVLFLNSNIDVFTTFMSDDALAGKMDRYQEKIESDYFGSSFTIYGAIMLAIRYSVFYLPMLFIAEVLYNKKYQRNPIVCSRNFFLYRLFQIVFVLMVVSFIMLAAFGLNNVFFYRILYISMIPISLSLGYLFINKLISKNKMYILMILSLGAYLTFIGL